MPIGCVWPIIFSNPHTNYQSCLWGVNTIYTLFQFFTRFEKWQLFGFDGYFFTGFRVPAGIAFIFFNIKAAKSPNFDAFALG